MGTIDRCGLAEPNVLTAPNMKGNPIVAFLTFSLELDLGYYWRIISATRCPTTYFRQMMHPAAGLL